MNVSASVIALFVVCILNILGSAAVFILYSLRKTVRSAVLKLVLYIEVSNFCYSLTWLVSILAYFINPELQIYTNAVSCDVQASVRNFAVLSCYFWNAALCVVLHRGALLHKDISTDFLHRILPYLLAVPLIMSVIPIITNNYSYCVTPILKNIVCDLDAHRDQISGILEVVFIQIIPFWGVFLYNSYIVVRLYCVLRDANVNENVRVFVKMFLFFPIIFMMCWLYLCLIDMVSLFKLPSESAPGVNRIVAYSLCNLQGLFNSILFFALILRLELQQAKAVFNAKTTIAEDDMDRLSVFTSNMIQNVAYNTNVSGNYTRLSHENSLWTNPSRQRNVGGGAGGSGNVGGGAQQRTSSRGMDYYPRITVPPEAGGYDSDFQNSSDEQYVYDNYGATSAAFIGETNSDESARAANNKTTSSLNQVALEQNRVYSSHSLRSPNKQPSLLERAQTQTQTQQQPQEQQLPQEAPQ